jgi:hypothetical protein
MDPWTPRRPDSRRSWWDRFVQIGVAPLLSAILAALIASSYAKAAADRTGEVKLVELAVGLLREPPRSETEGVREWAIRVLNKYSGVPLAAATQASLTNCLTFPEVSIPGVPLADLKVNGCDASITVGNEGFIYSWNSSQATVCQMTVHDANSAQIGSSGSTLSGVSSRVPSDHPWYPMPGGPVTFTFSCSDGSHSASDTITIRRAS